MNDGPLEPEIPEHPEFTPAHAVAWVMSSFFVLVLSSALLFSVRPNVEGDLVSLGALSAAVFLLMSALLLGKYPGGSRLSHAVGLRKTPIALVLLGFVIGATAQVPADRLRLLVERFSPLTKEEVAARVEVLRPDSLSHAASMVLVAVLLVPWAEEVFFRGAVFGALRRSGRSGLVAAIVTGIGFTLCHFDPRLWVAILLVAAILGFVRAASGSLWPGLAAHVGFNAVTIGGALHAWKYQTEGIALDVRQEWIGGGVLAVSLVLFGLVARLHGAPRSARSRETRIEIEPGKPA